MSDVMMVFGVGVNPLSTRKRFFLSTPIPLLAPRFTRAIPSGENGSILSRRGHDETKPVSFIRRGGGAYLRSSPASNGLALPPQLFDSKRHDVARFQEDRG